MDVDIESLQFIWWTFVIHTVNEEKNSAAMTSAERKVGIHVFHLN